MGMIKRMLRETSHKLLSKLANPRGSHRSLVLNHAATPAGHQHSPQVMSPMNTLKKSRPRKSSSRKMRERRSALSEAVLLAAKNYLPPVQFHHVHGPTAQLAKNKFVARRTKGFCQALVFSNRVILPNERVYIKVLEIAKGWSGTIRFGFTSVDPATLRYQMPKHACPDMTNAGHTWARALADEVVRRNSVIHFSYNSNGYIHYGINNQDCGVFYANVNTTQHLWFVVDIYGLTAAVELIDPRIHSATSELDFSRSDDEMRTNETDGIGNTTFKSTGAMDEITTGELYAGNRVGNKRRNRKIASRFPTAGLFEPWSPENVLMSPPITTLDHSMPGGPFLPNLNSLIIPTAQQNIYSPMPSTAIINRPAQTLVNDPTHDYHQIRNTNEPTQQPIRKSKLPSRSAASTLPANQHMIAGSSSALNDTIVSSASRSTARIRSSANEQELCQQLDSLQLDEDDGQNQQSLAKSSKSTSNNSGMLPAAAARRKQPQSSTVQTAFKRSPDTQLKNQTKVNYADASPQISKSKSSTAISKPKSRQTIQKASSRDNNNSPASKDCPICFERPINCVLYQCGHMCTCYECGVKQWRTQSRTCPICRTVIKDVIKTYLS